MPLNIVILAAGQGTRMRSQKPKVMHCLGGRPLLEHVLNAARTFSESRLFVVIGHGKKEIESTFRDPAIEWVHQATQLGTGHAVLQTLPFMKDEDKVLILYGDVPLIRPETLQTLMNAVKPEGLALITAHLEDPTGFGRIIRGPQNEVVAVVEHRDARAEELSIREVNTGIMLVPAFRLKEWLPRLDAQNIQKEYYLPDIIAWAVKVGCPVTTVQAIDEEECMGVNDLVQLATIERIYQKRQAERLILEGVHIRDPARFDLRGELSVGQNTTIDINVIIEGRVQIGSDCFIGPHVVLKNAKIRDGAKVLAYSIVEDASVGSECVVGPFARLRPGTELLSQAHVGNFVEVKASQIGEGSKANHLSYIGDTTVGAHVNVGAGTITCNYDGVHKHRTVIEEGAFIGSHTALVAPVVVGKNATIGAGTVLTEDAKPESLTVGRARQKTIRGWKRPS
ncbi:MAG: bifunctional UDP-N-acetylglucosamine diphosphorylase/glucosamine-1-phosphate N-acetyltransferase GlmU [Gammaproteobacteria bacterium]|nr:bifunctional UDP-N-acetylglucosamine diphosphorylase/glucosamine-1-phosphate N-acetyltransferase GlmU [Gammaproteobacteria bacterium]